MVKSASTRLFIGGKSAGPKRSLVAQELRPDCREWRKGKKNPTHTQKLSSLLLIFGSPRPRPAQQKP